MTSEDKLVEAYEIWSAGESKQKAADAVGIPVSTFKDYIKRREQNHEFLVAKSKQYGFPIDDVARYWIKDEEASICLKKDSEISTEEYTEFLKNELLTYSIPYKVPKVKHKENFRAMVLSLADLHFGKFATMEESDSEYDLEIAEQRTREGVMELLEMSKPFNVQKIYLVLGNDVLHYDNTEKTTTKGTYVGGLGTNETIFRTALRVLVSIVEMLAEENKVEIVHVPSNHDYVSGNHLAVVLEAWFRNHKNVEFLEIGPKSRKYIVFGVNCIGLTHGDKTRDSELHSLMSHDAKDYWGQTEYRYWYLGHLHHKIRKVQNSGFTIEVEKDHIGYTKVKTGVTLNKNTDVQIEYLRSPTTPDVWHYDNGHVNIAGMEAFIHDFYKGQIARLNHNF